MMEAVSTCETSVSVYQTTAQKITIFVLVAWEPEILIALMMEIVRKSENKLVYTTLHGATSQNTVFILTAVITWNINRPDDGGSKKLWKSVSFYHITQPNISEHSHLHIHRRDDLK
jgi:hypothetical protein